MITTFKTFDNWESILQDKAASTYRNYEVYSKKELYNLTKKILKEIEISHIDFSVAVEIVSRYIQDYTDDWKYDVIDSINSGLSENDILINIIKEYDFELYDITKEEIQEYIEKEIKQAKINKFNL